MLPYILLHIQSTSCATGQTYVIVWNKHISALIFIITTRAPASAQDKLQHVTISLLNTDVSLQKF